MSDVEDLRWLEVACELASSCPPSETAFSVGAVIVGADGRELARGFSRETDEKVHAEEAALAKIPGVELAGATVYSSLEPCARRLSRPKSCARLIVERGVRRVVFAWREPVLFVEGDGVELLEDEGVEVVEVPALAARAKLPNAHLL
ncbi:diaminohydroxyphosphoribosylaminopyrimidine deaminase [Actinocorallia herbida]|uniref:Diaminohydroxyphosphoribosylaminopyrimidine deaminase n=1 Tax=Actinocorallia herbida TaxID=58109 RepID=A0A3N1D628_9ACTN|nr:dCMP deaminase [Actinocorallia herbida]ROO88984.1 diaminohydroxyphosphoribosylaminopyrimidine deaminase [Actinocorallia herbida]